MLQRTFWTERRFTGLLLTLGRVLYVAAVACMPRDAQETWLVLLPEQAKRLLIAAQPSLTQWSFGLFITGSIVTLLGLAMLTALFWDAFDRTFSFLALIASLFGDVLMVIYIAAPLGVAPVAAQNTERTGMIPGYYVPLTLWTQPLFVISTILAFAALAAYCKAILSTRVLPYWVGWTAIAYGLAGLVLTSFTAGNAPPFLHHLLPILMGILLLRREDGRRFHLSTAREQA